MKRAFCPYPQLVNNNTCYILKFFSPVLFDTWLCLFALLLPKFFYSLAGCQVDVATFYNLQS